MPAPTPNPPNDVDARLPIHAERLALVRYERADGQGLYEVISDFKSHVRLGRIRITRAQMREWDVAVLDLNRSYEGAPRAAYRDGRSCWPITWFRASAVELMARAERVVAILNRHGADVRRIETSRPPPILWQDAVQVVTRRPRQPCRLDHFGSFESRFREITVEQRRCRDRRAWRRARRAKRRSFGFLPGPVSP